MSSLLRPAACFATLLPLVLSAAPAAPIAPPPARPIATPLTAPKPSTVFSLRNVLEAVDQYEVPYLEVGSSALTFRLSQPSTWQPVNSSDGSATFALRGYLKSKISFTLFSKTGFLPNVEPASMDSYASGLLVTYPEKTGHSVTFHNLGDYAWTKEAGSVVQTSKGGAVQGYSLRLAQRPFGTACAKLDYTVSTTDQNGTVTSIRTLDILSDVGDSILVSSYSNTPDVFPNTNLRVFQSTVLKGIAVKGFPAPKAPEAPKPPKTPAKPGAKPSPDDSPAGL